VPPWGQDWQKKCVGPQVLGSTSAGTACGVLATAGGPSTAARAGELSGAARNAGSGVSAAKTAEAASRSSRNAIANGAVDLFIFASPF
jgi:hypothetical protein